MSSRFWRFSLVVLAGTVIIAGAMALAYHNVAVENLREMRAEQNVELARSLSNTLAGDFKALEAVARTSSWTEMQQSEVVAEVAASIARKIEDIGILRVNIYSNDGLTLYSSRPEEIGVRVPSNPGIVAAAGGQDSSTIVRSNTPSEIDRDVETQDMIESYVPLRDETGRVLGVFEIHSDITPLTARIAETQSTIVLGVFVLMGVLSLPLIYMYRRLEKRFLAEQKAKEEQLRIVEQAKDQLESRIVKRTVHLQQERDLLQRALDVLREPAIVVDKEHRVSVMNRAARERYGDRTQADTPILCHTLLHGDDQRCDETCSPCALLGGSSSVRRVTGPDGDVFEYRATPVVDESGAATAVIEVVHEIGNAQHDAAEGWRESDSYENASRAKSELVATISHEIRTPLNAVLGMTDLLNLTNLTRKQRDYIQTIQSSGDMLLSLVDNLLDYSELEHGSLNLLASDFDIIDLLERVLRIMGHSAGSKGLELIGTIHHDLDLRVSADKRRLRQILVNIIGNAIKFTDEGEVVIDIYADQRDSCTWIKFVVSDSGVGIDDTVRQKLFTAFGSSTRPASSQTYGSGLGLTICKQLLDNMGGTIAIDSRDGGGTVVTVEVPATLVPSRTAEDFAVTELYQPRRVLGLFPNAIAAASICSYLDKWHMECVIESDVDDGLHRLRAAASGAAPFDCAIIDASLTGADGLAVARRIRKSPEVSDLPIVLLTSITRPLAVGEVSALGRMRCVNKPVLPLELRFAVLRVLQDSQSADHPDQQVQVSLNGADTLRVLVAEDNPVSSAVLQSMLASLGYDSDVVGNGPDVLDALEKTTYHLLLLDCQMPGMDGDMVTREIRQDPLRYGDAAVIVAVTADTTERHRARCLAAGMDFFMPKPVRLETLKSGIAEWAPLIDQRNGATEAEIESSAIRSNLAKLTGHDDDSFISGYIDLFLSDAESRLTKMVLALEEGDINTVRREGHALKGSCLELGADRMARYCEDLSAAASNENLSEADSVLRKIAREYARLRPVYESAVSRIH